MDTMHELHDAQLLPLQSLSQVIDVLIHVSTLLMPPIADRWMQRQ